MRSFFAVMAFLGCFASAALDAEESPYAGFEGREIKSLSQQQIADYLDGKGMGLALPGELNGYPGPKHVLELSEQLQLSESQYSEVVRVFETMQAQAISLGEQIVAAEASLDGMFANGSIDADSLSASASGIGLLQGQLRAVHLQAHIDTRELLTKHQVQQYVQLRGYSDHGDTHKEHHGHDM